MIRYAHADESADVLLAGVGYSAPVPSSAGVVFVAEVDGATVGVLVGVLDGVGPCAPVPPPHGYVLAVAVAPGRRRRGVGRALLDRFVAEARAVGVRWVFLLPEEGPGVAGRVEFFRAAGFTPVADPDEQHPAMGRSS
ncbi:GNAT family N-acetyltransferase [Nocardiopsis alba]|uniref:GNAT family N-acetyltransferase n=1 Tax=Nocardiopsis alba TaxID=53437 RepID=UPI00366DFAF2